MAASPPVPERGGSPSQALTGAWSGVPGATLAILSPAARGADGGATLNSQTTAAPVTRSRGPVLALLAAIAIVAVVVDQAIKQLSVANLDPHEPVRIFGGLIYLSLTHNSGAAFSFGRNYTFIFPLITIVVIGAIGWMALTLRSRPWAVSLGLALGGAIGNLGDRLFRPPGFLHGQVVDMISVFAPDGQVFAIFNVADSCLTAGVILAVLLELTGRKRDGGRAPSSAQHPSEITNQ
jgi:signal peptidase II